jgi:hypothetical protein
MDYEKGEAVGTAAPRQRSLDPASESQVLRDRPSNTHDIEAFAQAISLQAAARAARYAEGSRAISEEAGRGAFHTIGIQQEKRERVPLTPSFNLVMALAIGVAVFACVTYLMIGGNLLASQPHLPGVD